MIGRVHANRKTMSRIVDVFFVFGRELKCDNRHPYVPHTIYIYGGEYTLNRQNDKCLRSVTIELEVHKVKIALTRARFFRVIVFLSFSTAFYYYRHAVSRLHAILSLSGPPLPPSSIIVYTKIYTSAPERHTHTHTHTFGHQTAVVMCNGGGKGSEAPADDDCRR